MVVTVYSKEGCPQCEATRRDLEILGVDYAAVDLSEDEAALERLRGLGFRTLPVVEAGQQRWSGYDRERILGLTR